MPPLPAYSAANICPTGTARGLHRRLAQQINPAQHLARLRAKIQRTQTSAGRRLLTRPQLVEIGISGNHDGWGNHTQSFRLRSVLDLDALEAVVFNNMAYPLDGGAAYAYPVDERLQAFQIPLMPSLGEGLGWSLSAQALCEGLGASYTWDEDTQAATMVFRDVEIVLTAGSTTARAAGGE